MNITKELIKTTMNHSVHAIRPFIDEYVRLNHYRLWAELTGDGRRKQLTIPQTVIIILAFYVKWFNDKKQNSQVRRNWDLVMTTLGERK